MCIVLFNKQMMLDDVNPGIHDQCLGHLLHILVIDVQLPIDAGHGVLCHLTLGLWA